MTTTRYDFLGFASLVSRDATGSVQRELAHRLGRFEAPVLDKTPSIDLAPIRPGEMPGLAPDHLQSARGFSLATVNGEHAAVLPYRGKADVVLLPGETIRIRYAPRSGVAGKLFGLTYYVLQCALARSSATLFHGAALVKEERCLVLTGLQGARKTLVMMHLLRQGWDFLADDRFILHGGQAHLFHGGIPLMPHHFAALPWLEDIPGPAAEFAPSARRMRAIASWCERRIPSYLLPRLAKYHNKPLNVTPDQLFPQCATVESAKLTDIVILIGGREGAEDATLSDALPTLTTICDVEFMNFLRMELELKIRGAELRPPTEPILETGLAGVRLIELGVPDKRSPEDTAQEILACLQ